MAYIKEFLKNVKEVGSIAPSSKFLGEKMYKSIKFKTAKCIVEFGPGNGVFTKEILKRMNPDTILIIFETNPTFYNKLKESIKDERAFFINESAENLRNNLVSKNIEKADYIISSLPLSAFPRTLKDKILNCVKQNLIDDGEYIQYQYSLGALRLLKSKFGSVDLSFTAFNLPPAFVYRCKL